MSEIAKISKTNIFSCILLATICLSISAGAFYFEKTQLKVKEHILSRPTTSEISIAINTFKKEKLEEVFQYSIKAHRENSKNLFDLLRNGLKLFYQIFFVLGIFLAGFAFSFIKIKRIDNEKPH